MMGQKPLRIVDPRNVDIEQQIQIIMSLCRGAGNPLRALCEKYLAPDRGEAEIGVAEQHAVGVAGERFFRRSLAAGDDGNVLEGADSPPGIEPATSEFRHIHGLETRCKIASQGRFAGRFGSEQADYFEKISAMNLRSPQVVGFGISNQETFEQATQTTSGAIIGSAFIKFLEENGVEGIHRFVQGIRGVSS